MSEKKFDYYQEFQIFENLLYPMAQISDELTKKLDKKIYIEITLYAKFVLTAFSLSKLLPIGANPQENTAADIASVATLGRNLIEIYNFLYYMRLDKINIEESEFRRMIAIYHREHENHKIGTKMEANTEELKRHTEVVLELIKNKIKSHPFFDSMELQNKKKILKGESPMYLGRIEITKKYCGSYKLVNALYKVMSNYVHSGLYGFVISFDGGTFGCDNDKNRNKIADLLYLINYYLGLAISSILVLYPENLRYISKEYAELIKKLTDRF